MACIQMCRVTIMTGRGLPTANNNNNNNKDNNYSTNNQLIKSNTLQLRCYILKCLRSNVLNICGTQQQKNEITCL